MFACIYLTIHQSSRMVQEFKSIPTLFCERHALCGQKPVTVGRKEQGRENHIDSASSRA